MKKVLLASVALAGFATAAAAEVTLAGSGQVGIRQTAAGATATVFNGVKVTFGGTTETDSGIGLAVSASIKSGTWVDLDDVKSDDVAAGGNGLGTPTFTITTSMGTITMGEGKVDHLYDDATAGDIGYSHTFGAVSVGVVSDLNPTGALRNSFKLGYAADPLKITLTGDDTHKNKVEVGYSVSGIALTVASDENDGNSATTRRNSIKAAYTVNGFTGSVKFASGAGTPDTTTVGLGYKMDALAVDAEIVTPAGGTSTWKAYGSYDLGAGVSAVAGTNSANYGYAGLTFSF